MNDQMNDPNSNLSSATKFQLDAASKCESFISDTPLDFRMKRIIELSNKYIQDDHILCDIGCHDGALTCELKSNHLNGLDAAGKALELASKRGINTIACDLDEGTKYPFPDNYFDLVVCFDTLEHCMRTDHILNEINRMTKTDGLFICSVPNVNQLATILFYMRDLPAASSARYRNNHYRDFTLRTISGAVMVHGFKIEHAEGTYIEPFYNMFSKKFAQWFPRWAGTLMLICRKVETKQLDDGYCSTSSELINFIGKNCSKI